MKKLNAKIRKLISCLQDINFLANTILISCRQDINFPFITIYLFIYIEYSVSLDAL